MPIYEFECHSCGSQFELLRAFSEKNAPNCPTCESDHVARQLGRPAIHFKGSGWYITDSKKSPKTSANANGNTTDNGGDTKSESTARESTKSDTGKSESAESPKPVAKTTTAEAA